MAASIALQKIELGLANMRSRRDQAIGKLEMLADKKRDLVKALEEARRDIGMWRLEKVLFAKSSEFARTQLKTQIEKTVSAALQVVFEDSSAFAVVMKTVGDAPAANWALVSKKGDEVVVSDPEDGDGGGAADVVSLALRASLLELSRPKPEGPFILDEPGKMIDKTARPNTAHFVKHYIARTRRQGIMITHHDELEDAADVAYSVTQINGTSEVTRL